MRGDLTVRVEGATWSGDGDLRGVDDMGKGSITFASKRGQNVGWKRGGLGRNSFHRNLGKS